jgi:hypothetical protein
MAIPPRTTPARPLLPFAFLLASLSACGPIESAPPDDSHWFNESGRNEHAAIRFLWPVLTSAGKVGRFYYRAYCPTGGNEPVVFPKIDIDPPRNHTFDATDIQGMLRNNKNISVVGDANGIVRVSIGRTSRTILQTQISKVVLDPLSQYNELAAVSAIAWSDDVKAAMGRLKIRMVSRPSTFGVIPPDEKYPHLPAVISNLTLDEALDLVAVTFHSTILYGECTNSNMYDISVRMMLHFDGSGM